MSNLPVDPYDRSVVLEPNLDNPDRAPLAGTGRDFVVTLSRQPGAEMRFLSESGKWVTFTTTELTSWGGIVGNIEDQEDLQNALALKADIVDISLVGFTGLYNDLLAKPTLGDLSGISTNGSTSQFLRGDGQWAIPVDVYAQWGNIAGDINAQTDLAAALGLKAPLSNPIFTGTVRAPTPPLDDSSDTVATTGWFFGQAFDGSPVMDGVASSGDSTRWARGNHRHPTDDTRAPLESPQFTGMPTAPTPATGNVSQRLATTAFVAASIAAAGLTPPPSDGQFYGMRNGVWVVLDLDTKWDN